VISPARGAMIAFTAVLLGPLCRPTHASENPRYCLTIEVGLQADLREEVSAIDLTIENASVVSIPRFPAGWGIRVQNYVDNTPTKISGGATGNVAELQMKDLKCMFEVENEVPGTPPIMVTGSVYISNGRTERHLILHGHQFILEKITAE